MIFDHENRTISFRQSWLDTAFRCPERGRQAIVRPEWDELEGDSALAGTAAHAAIERVINGGSIEEIASYAAEFLDAYDFDNPGVAWKSFDGGIDELYHHATTCAQAWADDLAHQFDWQGARSEVTFKVPVETYRGWTIVLTGTIDLVPPIPELDDWKTSARPYKQYEKQKFAIQPTIYGTVAVKGGLHSDDIEPVDYRWPLTFRYGVMIRGAKKAKGQVVEVIRTEAHAAWAMHRIRQWIDLALDFGLDKPWPTTEENYLCSQKWCPWFSICRGAFVTRDLDLWRPAA